VSASKTIAIDQQFAEHLRASVPAFAPGANFQVVRRYQSDLRGGEKRLHEQASDQRDD
jgi:hypothetical protein